MLLLCYKEIRNFDEISKKAHLLYENVEPLINFFN